jgi:hypothetical protein
VIAGLYCPVNASFPVVCPSGSYCGASAAAPTACPVGAPFSNVASADVSACRADYGTHMDECDQNFITKVSCIERGIKFVLSRRDLFASNAARLVLVVDDHHLMVINVFVSV